MFLQENDKRGRYIYNGRIRDSEGGSVCVCESEKFSTTLAGRAFVEWDLRVCVCFFFLSRFVIWFLLSTLQCAVRQERAKLE